jgi:hypothetical protein
MSIRKEADDVTTGKATQHLLKTRSHSDTIANRLTARNNVLNDLLSLKRESYKTYDSEATILEAVAQDGNALQNAPESKMTPAVILDAFGQNGDALRYVKESVILKLMGN